MRNSSHRPERKAVMLHEYIGHTVLHVFSVTADLIQPAVTRDLHQPGTTVQNPGSYGATAAFCCLHQPADYTLSKHAHRTLGLLGCLP